MGSEPSTTNQTADQVNTAIKTTGNYIVAIVEKAIIADVPVLGLPIIKPLWEALFNWIAGYYLKAAQTGATFLVIDNQIAQEQNSMTIALNNLIAAQKSGDPVAIKKAIQAYADAQSALVHSDGSAQPK